MSKILIVGAGPVGLLLAAMLRQYNIDVVVIDKAEREKNKFSKALSVTSASLKAFHGLGLAQDFLNRGKKIAKADIFYNKKRVATVNKKYLNSLYNFYLSIPQFETERILEEKLNQYATSVQYQQELINMTQQKEHVQVSIRNLVTTRIKNEYFDFVIGCDGAHSTVRKLLEIPFVGHDYDIHFILGDAYFYENYSFEYAKYYVDKNGFIGFFPMENGCTRIVIQKKSQIFNSEIKPTKEDIQSYLDVYFPVKLSINNLVWSSSARITSRIAKSSRVERVFLAGDASHLFSPVGGQGMNTGIQDALELGWRMEYYFNGLAKESLLDTYNQNRMIAIKKVHELTDFYTKLIIGDIVSHVLKK